MSSDVAESCRPKLLADDASPSVLMLSWLCSFFVVGQWQMSGALTLLDIFFTGRYSRKVKRSVKRNSWTSSKASFWHMVHALNRRRLGFSGFTRA